MTLAKQTTIGMTIGQLIAAIALALSMGGAWLSMSNRVSQTETIIKEMKENSALEHNEMRNFMRENREDHIDMVNKMDKIFQIEINKNKS